MKNFLMIALLAGYCYGCRQADQNKVIAGVIDHLYSPTLKETRQFYVHVPDFGKSGANKEGRFPVLFLLDGDAHFLPVAGMVQQLSEINGNTLCPDMVIVAILNTDRTRDLTPGHVDHVPYMSADQVRTSGGAEAFTGFIQNELIPYVEAHYPVTKYRVLVGHSLGGLFVINTLAHHPDLFNDYVAIDPSLWWDHQKLLNEAKVTLQTKGALKDKSLFLGIANTMTGPGMDTASVKKDTGYMTLHIRSILEMASMLGGSESGLNASYKYYAGDNHGSVPLITTYDGLRYLFSFYHMPEDNFLKLTPTLFKDHFQQVSRHMGYEMFPPEGLINNLGYTWIQQGNLDRAQGFFQLNIDNYPDHANVYDSMGDLFVARKDNKSAIIYFTKAANCKDVSPETLKKLKNIKKSNP